MASRSKGALPSSLMSPLKLPPQAQGVELEFEVGIVSLPPEGGETRDRVRTASRWALETAEDSLRLEDVTEQQLAELKSAVRLEVLVRLLDLRLDNVAVDFVCSDGPRVSAVVMAELLPDISADL